jgi:carbon-monoxide dehydrogenase large subunit
MQRLVGEAVQRVEDARVLTGRGRYVDDVALPGMVHAAFVRSPYAHARIVSIDAVAARQLPGVLGVFTGSDLRGATEPFEPALRVPGLSYPCFYALAVDKVRLVGDPVALVVATSRYVAEDGAELVEVEYEPLDPVASATAGAAPGAPELFDDVPGNSMFSVTVAVGDVDAAFADADRVIGETFVQHRHANVPIETRGVVAHFDPGTGLLVCHASTQSLHMYRNSVASALRHPLERTRVLCGDIGGSFGLKGFLPREEVAVAFASTRVGRPVKWIEDRTEHLAASGQAREETFEVEAAVRANGTVTALRARVLMDHGAYPGVPYPSAFFLAAMARLMPGPYAIGAFAFDGQLIATNKCTYVAYRAPWEAETWVRERLLDVIGRELGIDPVDVRQANLVAGGPDDRMTTGASLANLSLPQSFAKALAVVDHTGFRAGQARHRAAGHHVGIGVANYIEAAPGPPEMRPQGAMFGGEQARVRLEADGHLTVYTSQSPTGQGHETTLAQVAAQEMGIPFEHVRIVRGDTELTPMGMVGTGASRAATWATGAVLETTRLVKQKALALAAEMLEIDARDLDIVDGAIRPKGVPKRALPLAQLARAAYLEPDSLPKGTDKVLEVQHRYTGEHGITGSAWASGTHVCVVEVDLGTGGVTILRYVVVEDCGRVINPAIVDGQIRGGVAQGLGGVLHERSAYDEDGQFLAATFMDYLLPTAMEIPTIEIHHLETHPEGEVDFRGVGEGGALIAPAALSNAIEDALAPFGARVTEQHLTPARILELAGVI